MKNILDTKFRHHSWFKEGVTKREAIEYFAKTPDFVLEKKACCTKHHDINLLDNIEYDDVLVYYGKIKSSYKLSKEEKEYYLKCKTNM